MRTLTSSQTRSGTTAKDDSNERLQRQKRAPPPAAAPPHAFADDHSYIDSVLDNGNDQARQIADHTLTTVHNMLGMNYANRRAPRASPT